MGRLQTYSSCLCHSPSVCLLGVLPSNSYFTPKCARRANARCVNLNRGSIRECEHAPSHDARNPLLASKQVGRDPFGAPDALKETTIDGGCAVEPRRKATAMAALVSSSMGGGGGPALTSSKRWIADTTLEARFDIDVT
jgi:hypothetical protein